LALADTSYVVYLTFIKNKSYRDSLKRPNKLEAKLEDLEINHKHQINDYLLKNIKPERQVLA